MRRLLDRIARPLQFDRGEDQGARALVNAEWLVTNGLGGYASGTVAGVNTRRYHGLLVAALPNPIGRLVMLNHLGERICVSNGTPTALSGEERVAGRLDPEVAQRLASFRLEAGLPVWEYEWEGACIEKRVCMPHQQNTVFVRYCLTKGKMPVKLELDPALHFRSYEAPVNLTINTRYSLSQSGGLFVFYSGDRDLPPLRVRIDGASASYVHEERVTSEFLYPVEEARGYEFRGTLWAPGRFEIDLQPDTPVTLVASAEDEQVMMAVLPNDVASYEEERRRRLLDAAIATHPEAADEAAAELVLAADQFIFTPKGRIVDSTRAAATGDEIRSVIAGYHWFTDWGRDTMISLEGLTLVTGRHREAGFILRTFEHYVRDGLIPNMFPDGSNEGLYHTADATLWFFHALSRYVELTDDRRTLVRALPTLQSIVDHHMRGTRFGIRVDPSDGLLTGRRGLSTHLDGREGRRVGRDTTPRQGRRDQRALVQRIASTLQVARRGTSTR